MAASVQSYQPTMTLGQPNKMYNVIQHSPPQNTNCVIVTSSLTPTTKTVIQSKRPLAPAPERTTSVLVSSNSDLRCKRKIQFMPYGNSPQQPASVARRNARERNRVKQVNNGFATLRQHIPPSVAAALSPPGSNNNSGRGASKKLSKVETLRLAVEYIRSLQQMIDDHETEIPSSTSGCENTIIDSGRYYSSSSPDSIQQYNYIIATPACSEASASPTPSHSSDGSISITSNYAQTLGIYSQSNQDNYENYEPKSPEDEELLDAIFSWQSA